jgi:5-methylcytosine-specific restriction protein A
MAKLTTLAPKVTAVQLVAAAPLPNTLSFADARRGSRQSRGYGTEWDRLRLVVLKRDRYRCLPCLRLPVRRVSAAEAVDHILEKADGGTDDPINLQSICVSCHRAKTAAAQVLRRSGLTSADLAAPWVPDGGAMATPGGVGLLSQT